MALHFLTLTWIALRRLDVSGIFNVADAKLHRIGWKDILAGLPYGQTHRLYRKYAHQQLGTKGTIAKYEGLQQAAVQRLLGSLLRDQGKNLNRYLKTYFLPPLGPLSIPKLR